MSKELVEKLREKADSLTTTVGVMTLLHEAADALEAKAAPVGEREAFESWAASVGYHTERDMFQREKYQSTLTWELWLVGEARAAHRRQQAREVVMPDADGSAAQKSFWAGFESASLRLFGTNIRAAWNSYKASDEFARLNGAGSHE